MAKLRNYDDVLSGVLIALGVVYSMDADPTSTMAQEIMGTVGSYHLIRVAVAEQDCYLPQLRKTAASIRKPRRKRNAN